MLKIKPVLLKGSWVALEPLSESHRKELYQSAQHENIWTFNASKAFGEKFHHWFDDAINYFQSREHLPFVVRRNTDQKILGSTRFYDVHHEHHRLAIGYTWLIPEMWGTYVNPECKYLLLKYAFDELMINRVELVTDHRNARSRAAIKKLGAKEEGILRQHMILADGYVRDSALFSIVKNEWPRIKKLLEKRLRAFEKQA